ncbi:MAG: hypothetical protein EPGJADBJ_00729 [Saprospiraceae bacterium]|nr:hypothetical protein [Saprospiraceae bacterium]
MEYRKMTKCFMNGKSCIYERIIDERLDKIRNNDKDKRSFVIMPFNSHLDSLYRWQIAPFIQNGGGGTGEEKYKCEPERADDVRQVGFIICEKICKKIQESNLVIVDVSFDNPNVFYELGLSMALRREILPICVKDFVNERQEQMRELFGIQKLMPYEKFDYLDKRISEFTIKYTDFDNEVILTGNSIRIFHDGREVEMKIDKIDENKNVSYDFGALCKTAAGDAIRNLFKEMAKKENASFFNVYKEENFEEIKDIVSLNLKIEKFKEVIKELKKSACVLIDTSSNHIANFFWLGYIHGSGGYAVPINTIVENPKSTQNIMPFDIRALWHIVYKEGDPSHLSNSIKEILEFIYSEKAKYYNRSRFWKNILKDNNVSIFIGSLFHDGLKRNTIGDWDYRTAAELTSFLSSSKETMNVTLESPIPKHIKNQDENYINWLKQQITNKNCILIGSPDVNDLVEIALCAIWKKAPFKRIKNNDLDFSGYIPYKKYNQKPGEISEMAFFRYDIDSKAKEEKRGFIIKDGTHETKFEQPHNYPGDDNETGEVRTLLGQLVVVENPFSSDKRLIIISGISGPATLGIAQMLTGCVYKEFTTNAYQKSNLIGDEIKIKNNLNAATNNFTKSISKSINLFPTGLDFHNISYDDLSEFFLERINSKFHNQEFQALINIYVYYPEIDFTNDERKVLAWNFPALNDLAGNNRFENPGKIHL